MEHIVLIPLKKTSDIDLVKHLKVAISSQYGNVDDNTKESLEKLNHMRSNAISQISVDTRNEREGCLETWQKYYDQISLLNLKLPNADVSFKWKDAFDKGGYIFSSGSLTVSSINYEKVCTLFNIAALMNNIGAYYAKESSFGDDSLKKAIQYFQGSAGIFQALKHTAISQVNQAELTFDLKPDVLNLFQHILMAQVQEVFFYKATNDKMKETSIAQIAAHCEDYYLELLKILQAINSMNKTFSEWTDVFIMKQYAYRGIAEYYQSLVAKSSKQFGVQIARLTKAVEFLKLAQSKMPTSSTLVRDYLNKATQDLEVVKKDNDFIYHDKIPEYKSLPVTNKRSLVKITDLPERFLSEPELFSNLLPLGVHQSMQKLEQYRTELVNTEISSLREATQTLNATLASLNLPAALEDTKGVEVPKSLKEKSAMIKSKGGVVELDRLLSELPDLLKRNQEILDEIERSLNAEQESDNNLKAQFGDKWSRTPSVRLNQAWRDQLTKYQSIISTAKQADNKIKNKYMANIAKIKILSNANEKELANAIPSNNSSQSNVNESSVHRLKELMIQVESLKREREALENDLKNIEIEEIKSKFIKSMNVHTDVNESSLSSETMASFYGDIQKSARDNKQKQEELIALILSANDEFVGTKGSTVNKREQFLKDLATAYDAYIELSDNLIEGTKFYNDLTQVLVNLQVKVNDFCFARKAEREELCKDLQNEIVNRPSPPAPEAPKYQKSETQATIMSAPTMPTGSYPYPSPTPATYQPYPGYYPPPPLPHSFNPYMPPPQPNVAPYYPNQGYGNPYYPGYQQPPPH